MEKDNKVFKKATEQISERVDALEITILMLLSSLTNVKSFEFEGEKYNFIGKIPDATLKMMESIVIKNNKG